LYQKNGTVYVAARSEERASKAIEEVKLLFPDSAGRIEFLHLDLSDLADVK